MGDSNSYALKETYDNNNSRFIGSPDKTLNSKPTVMGDGYLKSNNQEKIQGVQSLVSKIKCDSSGMGNNKTPLPLPNGKHVKPNDVDRNKRKKFKEPGVIYEYLASAIPNNIGDKLSVDKLVDFVNGGVEKDSSKAVKFERKVKIVIGNKKQENDKNVNNLYQNKIDACFNYEFPVSNSNNSVIEERNVEAEPVQQSHKLVTNDKNNSSVSFDEIEKVDCFADNSLDQDDEFYQVVRRKNRNRTKILQIHSTTEKYNTGFKDRIKLNSKTPDIQRENISCKISESSFITNSKVNHVNDIHHLNWFIYHLWIEFQKNHDKYLQEQNDPVKLSAN